MKAIQVYYIPVGLMATRALTLRVHLLGQNKKNKNIYIFFGGQKNVLIGLR